MAVKWNFENLDCYIKDKYPNIKLIRVIEGYIIKPNRKRHIEITNGERTKIMELTNFLSRGCDFYEKTDKTVTLEYVNNKTSDFFKSLNINVELIKVEHTEKTHNTYCYFKYKEYQWKQHWGSFMSSRVMHRIEYFIMKEKYILERYNLKLINYDYKSRKFTITDGNVIKIVSENCIASGQFSLYSRESKTNAKIKDFMKERYRDCTVISIDRRPCTENSDKKNYIFVEFEYSNEIYDIEYGRLKKGFNFYANEPLGEKIIKQILNENNIKFEWQKKFDNLKNIFSLRYDFYLPDYNSIIECHGIQHYEPVEAFGGVESFIKNKKRDEIKTEYAKDNNIKLYIINRGYEFSANKINIFIEDCKSTIKNIVGEINERPVYLC